MSENMLLRKLLWFRHGCPPHGLYGDDGEMQCSICMIDFLRDSAEKIEQRFREINEPKLAEFLKAIKSGERVQKSTRNSYPKGEDRE